MTQQIPINILGFDPATQAELDTEKSRIAALEVVQVLGSFWHLVSQA